MLHCSAHGCSNTSMKKKELLWFHFLLEKPEVICLYIHIHYQQSIQIPAAYGSKIKNKWWPYHLHNILFYHCFISETPFGNVDQCFQYFRELLLCHSVKVRYGCSVWLSYKLITERIYYESFKNVQLSYYISFKITHAAYPIRGTSPCKFV